MKVKTDISPSLIGRVAIVMYVKSLNTVAIVFIGNIITCLTSH